jgi:hypothetical protein
MGRMSQWKSRVSEVFLSGGPNGIPRRGSLTSLDVGSLELADVAVA